MSEYFVLNPAISDKVLDGHLLMKSYDLFPCKSVFMLIAFLCCVLYAVCEFRGECKVIDATWKEGCITYTCKLIAKGPNFVQTIIEEIHGLVLYNYFMSVI